MPTSKESFAISVCPNCGSPEIQRVRQDWSSTFRGEKYTVKGLEYYSCPNCQEKVYPPEAMQRIQAASPGYSKRSAQRVNRRSSHAA